MVTTCHAELGPYFVVISSRVFSRIIFPVSEAQGSEALQDLPPPKQLVLYLSTANLSVP